MHFWRELLVMWVYVVHVYAAPLSSIVSSSTRSVATPLVIPASQQWDGNDGPWSSIFLRVGSDNQTVRVLVSTSSNQPLVVPSATCNFDGPDCANDHGGLFQSSTSTTWTSTNVTYSVALDTNIGLTPDVRYGYDSIALGYLGSGTPTLPSQLVGETVTSDLYTGFLGLSPLATNFSNGKAEVASYMSSLRAQNQIPSLSYGYNAGNGYRYSTALASLTLGGYDASLFNANNLTFAFNTQSSSDLTVFINSITRESVSGNGTLLATTVPAFIDSTTPYIWLPVDVCTQFELQFGIQYDNLSGLYLVNETLHDSLLAQNANITFTLGNTTSSEKVDIVLPYAAFDLIASSPLVSTPTRYFPLKRANTTSQVTLGRTFLQEAYLIADYERSTFSVSQMSWHSNSVSNIIPILPTSGPSPAPNSTAPISQQKRDVPATTIIAATVSGSAFIIILVTSIVLIRLRQKKLDMMTKMKSPPSPPTPAMAFASIVHEENCQHCRTQTPPSPEFLQPGSGSGTGLRGSPESGQTSSLGNNDNREQSTPIPGGLTTAPLLVSPLSPSPEGASSQENEDPNTQISPLTPGPAIPPRFSSLDRAVVPTTYDESPVAKTPSVKSNVYEPHTREEGDLDFIASTPIESLLQAALDQVIASHNQEYEEQLKSQSQPRGRGGYLALSPSSPPPEEEEEARRQVDSPVYGESSLSTLPSQRPNPNLRIDSLPRKKAQTNSQHEPYTPNPENISHPRVLRIDAPLPRFNLSNNSPSSTPPPQPSGPSASNTNRLSSNLNNQTQSFTFDTQPRLRVFPPGPKSQTQTQRFPVIPTSRCGSPSPSLNTRPSPSNSHQQQLGLPPTPRPTSRSLTPQQVPPLQSQTQALNTNKRTHSRSHSSSRPSSQSPPKTSIQGQTQGHRRTSSNSPPNKKRNSKTYPPPTSPPPLYPLPDLPGFSLSQNREQSQGQNENQNTLSPTEILNRALNQVPLPSPSRSQSQIISEGQGLSRSQSQSQPPPHSWQQSQNRQQFPTRSSSFRTPHSHSLSQSQVRSQSFPHRNANRRQGRVTIIEEDEREDDVEIEAEAEAEAEERDHEERRNNERRNNEQRRNYNDERGPNHRRDVREYSWLRLDT